MKIVLVDPSRLILKVTSGYLAETGYDVVAFTDATEALAHVQADAEVEVLVTGLEPHGLSGLDLCRLARDFVGARRALHVIVMSSSSESRRIAEALDAGADDFMSKPPEPEEFLARLRVAARATAAQRELLRLATVDGLTGLLNRRAFFEAAEQTPGQACCLTMFDIDRFKQINDSFGHAAGDRVIAAVAREAARQGDVAGRLGGEEFALVVPERRLADAIDLCEDLRARIAALSFADIHRDLAATCSFGVVARGEDEDIGAALQRADIALYAAKTSGRNRVVAATAPGDRRTIVMDRARPTSHGAEAARQDRPCVREA
ncbi:diguanylate cyclase [Methylopila musalis]|uniref:diguanylate cyclase n=1 Tax=Methylopila musalis TaxID=1134781 RepID=A0ABW3Z835_9HYPH